MRRGQLFVGLFAGLLVGCAFIVDAPDEFGEHCRFAGRDTDCGACLARRCERQLDACCEGAWCGGLIDAIEGCAQSGDGRCAEVQAAKSGPEGDRKALALCMSDLCRGVCAQAAPTSSSRCGETRFGAGTACVCTPATPALPANGYRCDEVTFPAARCCKSPSWPAVGNQCACLAVACTASSDSCACSLTDSYNPKATSECSGPICCQTDTVCRCGTDPCEAPKETEVDFCGVSTTPCTERTVPIESCTLP